MISSHIHRLAVKVIGKGAADVRNASLVGHLSERGHERGHWLEPKLPPYRHIPWPVSVARQRVLDEIDTFVANAHQTRMDIALLRHRLRLRAVRAA